MALLQLIKTALRGSRGLAQSAAGVGLTDQQQITDRRRICAMCDYATRKKKTTMQGLYLLSPSSQCSICKCAVHFKTRLAKEKCPAGKW